MSHCLSLALSTASGPTSCIDPGSVCILWTPWRFSVWVCVSWMDFSLNLQLCLWPCACPHLLFLQVGFLGHDPRADHHWLACASWRTPWPAPSSACRAGPCETSSHGWGHSQPEPPLLSGSTLRSYLLLRSSSLLAAPRCTYLKLHFLKLLEL